MNTSILSQVVVVEEKDLFVSRAICAEKPIGTATDFFWDGFYGYCEGQQLEDMPTAQQQRGWWAALEAQGESQYDGSIEDDHEWLRGGC